MRALVLALLVGAAAGTIGASPVPAPSRGDCASERDGRSRCVYRSFAPSTGIVTSCRSEHDCRVGSYYGNPTDAVWFGPPPGFTTLSRPEVTWLTATLAQVRVSCGRSCSFSYFFEAQRRRLSAPRPSVLAADPRRFLVAMAEDRALVIRQMFSGREIMRIERDWAPADWLGDVLPDLHFDPDGRLSFTWLRGAERARVNERLSVPSMPRS
jgi:hypothetical protein